jgi:2-phosphosulfolactate phosphatase
MQDTTPTNIYARLTVDVALSPLEVAGAERHASTVYIVLDVIRATTTLSVLFEQGCRRVLLAPEVDAARRAKAALGGSLLLAGEVGGLAPPDFDWGNSPADFAGQRFEGQELLFATTNGTRAVHACVGGRAILAGSLRNARAVAHAAITLAADAGCGGECLIVPVCAGRENRAAYDDALCAGAITEALLTAAAEARLPVTLESGAQIARDLFRYAESRGGLRDALAETRAAQALERVGLGRDVDWCAERDVSDWVPYVTDEEAPHGLLVVEAFGAASHAPPQL